MLVNIKYLAIGLMVGILYRTLLSVSFESWWLVPNLVTLSGLKFIGEAAWLKALVVISGGTIALALTGTEGLGYWISGLTLPILFIMGLHRSLGLSLNFKAVNSLIIALMTNVIFWLWASFGLKSTILWPDYFINTSITFGAGLIYLFSLLRSKNLNVV